MLIATWNLNNRCGARRFRPETGDALAALNPDLMVFTEFFPQGREKDFRNSLEVAGWNYQLASAEPPEVANRVLIVSKCPNYRKSG